MTLIDDLHPSDTDVEVVYALDFDTVELAVDNLHDGLIAVLRLGQDPDYNGPEDIAETVLDHAFELADSDRAVELWDAATELLAELAEMGPEDRARMLAEADAVADEKFYAVAGYPAGGVA